jgi:NAD(P)-dependent dehydrogenase (short-subunit alcohol dehydrogenase family)
MQANSPTSKLSGKIALVTGGTSGIALATTKKFVVRGSPRFITGASRDGFAPNVRERTEGARYRRREIAEVASKPN